jgi:acyl-CoA reductase-like NAD-dependent aldehyde dehydrogenase
VADAFIAGLVKSADEVQLGDPLKKGVFLGPVATKQSYEDYQRYAELARSAGAGVVRAGAATVKDGAFEHGYFVRPSRPSTAWTRRWSGRTTPGSG